MKPNSHLLGQGCVRCGYESLGTRFRKRLEDFVREASRKHGDYYDYSDFIYQRNRVAGTIICAKHGKFEQTPKKHLMGQGCPACSSSNGENKVRRFLESKGIRFQTEVRLITGTRYSFDFVLSDSKVLVEFNGKQHYQPIKFFGGKKGFRRTQERDRFKAQWAAENGFELIVIPYWEFPNIDNILTERLFGLEKAA
jgi:very-short-patch-repair endonuclease